MTTTRQKNLIGLMNFYKGIFNKGENKSKEEEDILINMQESIFKLVTEKWNHKKTSTQIMNILKLNGFRLDCYYDPDSSIIKRWEFCFKPKETDKYWTILFRRFTEDSDQLFAHYKYY